MYKQGGVKGCHYNETEKQPMSWMTCMGPQDDIHGFVFKKIGHEVGARGPFFIGFTMLMTKKKINFELSLCRQN